MTSYATAHPTYMYATHVTCTTNNQSEIHLGRALVFELSLETLFQVWGCILPGQHQRVHSQPPVTKANYNKRLWTGNLHGITCQMLAGLALRLSSSPSPLPSSITTSPCKLPVCLSTIETTVNALPTRSKGLSGLQTDLSHLQHIYIKGQILIL